jgi:hypothetical protein
MKRRVILNQLLILLRKKPVPTSILAPSQNQLRNWHFLQPTTIHEIECAQSSAFAIDAYHNTKGSTTAIC